jgi:hypothetical protein
LWNRRIEPGDCLTKIAPQNSVADTIATKHPSQAKSLVVPGIKALPAELVVQVVCNGLLDKTIFVVNICDCHLAIEILLIAVLRLASRESLGHQVLEYRV